jgi:hypothetical protein
MSGDDYCRVIALWNYAGTVERSKTRQAAAATGGEPGRENSRAEAENEGRVAKRFLKKRKATRLF